MKTNVGHDLSGFDPLSLFLMNEIKIVSYSFSSSAIEYNSNSYHDIKKA